MLNDSSTRSSRSSYKMSTIELRERLRKSREDMMSSDEGHGTRVSADRRRSKKIVVKRKDGSFALVNKDAEKKAERKSSVKDCLQKYKVETSLRGLNKPLPPDPYSDEKSLSTLDTSGSISLGSEPPPKDNGESREIESSTSAFEKKANSSLDFSLDKVSLDLSQHGRGRNFGGDISTQASQEQWARFKLLGRTGLGEIEVSRPLRNLIDRNFEILKKSLKNIAAIRDDMSTMSTQQVQESVYFQTGQLLDEVRETIDFSAALAVLKRDPDGISLNPRVEEQLLDYITVISAMYRDNPFHNFEHASTVLGAVTRLISQVARPDDMDNTDMKYGCGITNDPWVQFALVFSALIHDVDHAGVSNAQLIKEKSLVAGAYKNRSVAEQNSIELSWNLLMEPCYKEFRETIFATPSECSRFRGLVVTAVMATDIADKELAKLRKDRAAEALNAEVDDHDDPDAKLISQKATYVVETLIQAADISHTMQSFQMYKKWNHKLFREMYEAYKSGRAEKDPSEFWYNGEFGFFDFYIVPLCNKLKGCGIFTKSAEDYLQNAKNNRKTWEGLGEDLVAGYLRRYDEQKTSDTEKRPPSRGTATTVQSEDPYDSEESPFDSDVDSFGDESDDSSSFADEEDLAPPPKRMTRGNKGVAAKPKKITAPVAKRAEPSTPIRIKRAVEPSSPIRIKRAVEPGSPIRIKRAVEPSSPIRIKRAIEPSSPKIKKLGDSPIRLKRIVTPRRHGSDEGKKQKKPGAEKKDGKIVRRIMYRSRSADSELLDEDANIVQKRRPRARSIDAHETARRGSIGSRGSTGSGPPNKKEKKEKKTKSTRGRGVLCAKLKEEHPFKMKGVSQSPRRSRSNDAETSRRLQGATGRKLRSKSLGPDLKVDDKKKEKRGKKPKTKTKKALREK